MEDGRYTLRTAAALPRPSMSAASLDTSGEVVSEPELGSGVELFPISKGRETVASIAGGWGRGGSWGSREAWLVRALMVGSREVFDGLVWVGRKVSMLVYGVRSLGSELTIWDVSSISPLDSYV